VNSEYGFEIGMPMAASTYSGQIDWLMGILHVAMIGMFLIWGVYFVYCLIAYRARPGGQATYHQTGEKASFIPDGIVLAFELWLILGFGIPIWNELKQETPPVQESLEVVLVAQQFAWNFQYAGPDGVFGKRDVAQVSASNPIGLDESDPASKDDFITINNLYVPVNKPVILRMTSKDVIHDFQVTNFRNKQDILPGSMQTLWFEPDQTGKYEIGCAQLCGVGHTQMIGNVWVETPEDYKEWEREQIEEAMAEADADGSDSAQS
jgi:cytochrome c oxidase subunit 2